MLVSFRNIGNYDNTGIDNVKGMSMVAWIFSLVRPADDGVYNRLETQVKTTPA